MSVFFKYFLKNRQKKEVFYRFARFFPLDPPPVPFFQPPFVGFLSIVPIFGGFRPSALPFGEFTRIEGFSTAPHVLLYELIARILEHTIAERASQDVREILSVSAFGT